MSHSKATVMEQMAREVLQCCSALSLREDMCFRGAFMFLKPSLSSVSVIYVLPFSTSVWIIYILSVAILTAVLMFTRRMHQHVNPSSSLDYSVGWGDTIMDSLAILCQQGDSALIFSLA